MVRCSHQKILRGLFSKPVFFHSVRGGTTAPSPLIGTRHWGETAIRGGAPLKRQCPCSGRASANLSFSIWDTYYLRLRTEQVSNVTIAVDNGLRITYLAIAYIWCVLLLLLWVSFALQARFFPFTLVMRPVRLICFPRSQKLLRTPLKSYQFNDCRSSANAQLFGWRGQTIHFMPWGQP